MHKDPDAGATDSQEAGHQPADTPVPSRRKLLPPGGTLGGVLAALVLVAAGGGLVSAASLSPRDAGSRPLEAPQVAVPAGGSVGVCPGPARLLEGTPVGTDPQFSPESATAKSAVNAVVLSSTAGVLPGSRLSTLKGKTLVELAKATGGSAPATADARPAAGAPAMLAGVVNQHSVDAVSVLGADAQANRRAAAGAVMSYNASDGDLRGSPRRPASSRLTICGWSGRTRRSAALPS